MKVMIKHEHNASSYIYSGLTSALREMGHECSFWNDGISAFDAFDVFEPDFFLGQGYNLDRATIKCIALRPSMRVLLKVGCWGPVCQDVDTDKYPILMHSMEEIRNVESVASSLSDTRNLVLFNYVHPNRKNYLMSAWEESVAKTIGLLPAADTSVYFPDEFDKNLECDIGFVGGYWPYKGENFDKYIIPLCFPVGKYNIKIFGNQAWPVSQYMGLSGAKTTRRLFSSAKICPNVSEPHANIFGFEVNERVFKLAASKSFFISDKIDSLTEDIFTNGEAVVSENPKDFHALIDEVLNTPELRKKHVSDCYDTVMKNHTYKHRVKQIIESFEP